jgi:hypothetical protein
MVIWRDTYVGLFIPVFSFAYILGVMRILRSSAQITCARSVHLGIESRAPGCYKCYIDVRISLNFSGIVGRLADWRWSKVVVVARSICSQ